MQKIFNLWPGKIIEYSFYLLFFLVPLVLTPINYELFEYNKMILTYSLATIIVGFWLIKMVVNKRIIIKRTPLDIPLVLFLISQIVSTVISIDRHVSIWGYYSRFNGGLLSTISYIPLYYAFVSNFPAEKIKKLLKIILISGLLVSIYGILEHFGIDKDIWVQDVQNRVFSTLGQPNWLAAYLAVLIPITVSISLQNLFPTDLLSNVKSQKSIRQLADKSQNLNVKIFNIGLLGYWVIGIIFYLTLIFTKSRSGFLGFWIADVTAWLLLLVKFKKQFLNSFIIYHLSFIIITFLLGAPFDQINKYTLPQLSSVKQSNNRTNEQTNKPVGSSVIDVGITESGTIRKIVWRGAVDIFRHYPIFGTGVETFAFAYYKFRPVEHNMTSEWDFLYNKAHNEYLNYAATTGAFGLGSYLLIILVFILGNLNTLFLKAGGPSEGSQKGRNQASEKKGYGARRLNFAMQLKTDFGIREGQDPQIKILIASLFSAWLSILITNFFGFSVVIIQLFFFLIPAIVFVLSDHHQPRTTNHEQLSINTYQLAITVIILSSIFYFLFSIAKLWYADVIFADGYRRVRSQEVASAYQTLKKALEINQGEPFYYDEFSYPAAQIAVALADEKQATLSAAVTREAIIASNFAVSQSPQNLNFWKTRTRVFYTLSTLDEKYFTDALTALERAKLLAPTDPKIRYNLGLLYDRVNKKEDALRELEETTKLKPDYRDVFYALAYIYEKNNKRGRAKEMLQYILTKIATDDAEAKKKLEELK